MKKYKSIGDGKFNINEFKNYGKNIIIEKDVKIFNEKNIFLEDNVYIGHNCIINSYINGEIFIGENSWIGQNSYLHGAGKIKIGKSVGIGPLSKIFTSFHNINNTKKIIINNEIIFKSVIIDEGSDIGVGSIIMPGVKIGKNCMIGAGSVVTKTIPSNCVVAGVPAKIIKKYKNEKHN